MLPFSHLEKCNLSLAHSPSIPIPFSDDFHVEYVTAALDCVYNSNAVEGGVYSLYCVSYCDGSYCGRLGRQNGGCFATNIGGYGTDGGGF